MRRLWWGLSVLCPVAFAGDRAGWPAVLVFILSGLGTIPAAAMLGRATEEIALGVTAREVAKKRAAGEDPTPTTLGAKVGGLLNATFGNVPELFIGLLALHQGYVSLTKATIAGSVIGNAALVLGIALFFGGIRNGTQRFDAKEAGHHAVLMALAVTALVLPSLFEATTHSNRINEISIVAAILLLVVYGAYLLFSIFQMQGGPAAMQAGTTFIDDETAAVQQLAPSKPGWSTSRSIGLLALATVLIFGASEALVDTVGPFTKAFGWSAFFVGMVVVPILGNLAEQSSAVMLAWKNKMNTSLGVASGSSIQVALFIAPLLVLLSQFGTRMTLAFNPIEISVLALVVVTFYFISQDGESNWLEGLQLMVLYGLAGTVFFFVPGQLR
ncbi:MAG TPA: calcium/proton exchanger [Chloroflexota bacterium]|nr:calcium/proton exchanger [Chloroflexota bacterium]